MPVETEMGHIRLGDVVVGKPRGDHTGVAHYDNPRGEYNTMTGAPSPGLLKAAKKASAQAQNSVAIQQQCARIDVSRRGLKGFRVPRC